MRLVALNVGMPGPDRAAAIAGAILASAPDVAVLAEVAKGEAARLLRDTLKEGGLGATVKGHLDPPLVPHTIAFASRAAHASVVRPFDGGPWAACALEVEVDGVVVVGVHTPAGPEGDEFIAAQLGPHLDRLAGRRAIVLGTLGTGDPGIAGWVDALATRGPGEAGDSWTDPATGRGVLVDRALVSPALTPALRDAYLVQAPREAGLTAHAALVVEVV
jgi:hypothetical protein